MSNFKSNAKSFPYKRQLTILESLTEPHKSGSLPGVAYRPVSLRPCLMLRGKWFEDAGFRIGGKVSIKVRKNKLVIKPLSSVEQGSQS